MLKFRKIKLSLAVVSSIFLVACGGGGSSSSNSTSTVSPTSTSTTQEEVEEIVPNMKPIANAGADQNITFGLPIELNAKDSSDKDGEIVKYSWSLDGEVVGTGSSIALNDIAEGTYIYTLTVTDDDNATSTDSIEIRTYSDSIVKFDTNQGEIVFKLMTRVAPKAVTNFTTHCRDGYYDGVIFHRVIKDFMIQGGDPTGTGMGGESIWGTPFSNEIDSTVTFDRPFLLAMANAGGTKTNGSQFFITTEEFSFGDGKYTIFGEVIDGTETVTKIENVRTGERDKPLTNQTIEKATFYFELK